MMKKSILILTITLMSLMIFNNVLIAEETAKIEKCEYSLDLSYMGNYVWRGINATNDSVFQPSVTAAYKGWSFNIWGNMDMTNINARSKEFTEIDYTLDYTWTRNKLTYNLGVIRYAFPKATAGNTTEIYGKATFDTCLSPFIAYYQDIDVIKGPYLQLGIAKTFGKIDTTATVGYASADYNRGYFGVNKEAFSDLTLSLSVPVQVSSLWTMTTSLNYSTIMNNDLRKGRTNNDNLWGGLTWSRTF